jgi:membrane-associated protease RseP (regulator of RpoE activity)
VQDVIRSHGGRNVAIQVQRAAELLTLHTTILANGPGGEGVGFLGIGPKTLVAHPSVVSSIGLAPVRTAEVLGDTVAGLGHIFSPSGISAYLSNFSSSSNSSPKAQETAANARFVSPVGVAGYASDAVAAGWAAVFSLLIVINVSIGFINLLPLIPFDGGHIAVAVYEAVMTKIHRRVYRVDFAKLMPIAVATLSILAFIFLSSIFLDIAHPAANPF